MIENLLDRNVVDGQSPATPLNVVRSGSANGAPIRPHQVLVALIPILFAIIVQLSRIYLQVRLLPSLFQTDNASARGSVLMTPHELGLVLNFLRNVQSSYPEASPVRHGPIYLCFAVIVQYPFTRANWRSPAIPVLSPSNSPPSPPSLPSIRNERK